MQTGSLGGRLPLLDPALSKTQRAVYNRIDLLKRAYAVIRTEAAKGHAEKIGAARVQPSGAAGIMGAVSAWAFHMRIASLGAEPKRVHEEDFKCIITLKS
jgi:hypothetical protein